MTPDERPQKKDAFLSFLTEGWVSVHLDARRVGVTLPGELTENPHLVLQYGQDMPIPIPDLVINDQGIGATLSFARISHKTFIPWTAVYIVACTDGRGVVYVEDAPEEVSIMARPPEGTAEVKQEPPVDAPAVAAAPLRPVLGLVPAEAEGAGDDDDESSATRKRRPKLRLVR